VLDNDIMVVVVGNNYQQAFDALVLKQNLMVVVE
jgi:hypothetical protein